MPRRICDDKLALFSREKAVGNVNGNALFALGGKPINEERKVNLLTLRASKIILLS
jgi:hypothetical protein